MESGGKKVLFALSNPHPRPLSVVNKPGGVNCKLGGIGFGDKT